MPIYEYKCDNCGKKFELFIRGQAGHAEIPETAVCPVCSNMAKRLVVPSNIGWAWRAEPFYDEDFKNPRKEDI